MSSTYLNVFVFIVVCHTILSPSQYGKGFFSFEGDFLVDDEIFDNLQHVGACVVLEQ